MIALSGADVRDACAAMRLTVSLTARWLGRPVRPSVEARNSASARLRRFASTGAACATESRMAAVCLRLQRLGVLEEHRADHLAADQQRLAGGPTPGLAADLTAGQRLVVGVLAVGSREQQRHAGARLGINQGQMQRRVLAQRGCRLEPVIAVVAVQNHRAAAGNRAFDLAFEQVMRDLLAVGHLKDVDELAPLDHLVECAPEGRELIGSPVKPNGCSGLRWRPPKRTGNSA